MSDLDSTAGIVALIAALVALVALGLNISLLLRLRALRADQRVVLGDAAPRDLVAHAAALASAVDALRAESQRRDEAAGERLRRAEARLDRSLSHSSVVRYDAYDEMSGRQSSSIAILDDHADGILVSSILHREQARVYAKRVAGGESELGISPEEREAIDGAMALRGGSAADASED